MTTFDDIGRIQLDKGVKLKPYVPREFKKRECLTDEELYINIGGTMICDTETYINYHLLAFKHYETGKYIIFEIIDTDGFMTASFSDNDKRKISWILHSYRVITFNGNKYDIPLIWLVISHAGSIDNIKSASDKIIFYNVRSRDLCKHFNYLMFNTNHVDLIEVCPLRGSLKLYMARLHAKRIQDLPFPINEPLQDWQIPVVRDYCCNDLDGTELLLNNLKEQLQLRENLTNEYRINLMSKSDAQIAESVISLEIKKLTGEWPKKPDIKELDFPFIVPHNMYFQTNYMRDILNTIISKNFSLDEYGRLERNNHLKDLKIHIGKSIYRMGIGGLHSSEEITAYHSNNEYQIYDRDVASFYPEIVRKLKLYPEHLGSVFLDIYNELVERRLAYKKAKQIAESENLKVTINGTFGKTGSPHSVIYAPQMTIAITVGGQLYLLMLIEALELKNIKVISANTDGIVIYCHNSQVANMNEIIRLWEKQTGFITEETKYSSIYSRDVNAYLAIKPNGEVKGKNSYYDPWRGKTAKDAYWRFQKNPQNQICVEAIERLLINNIAIDQTIKECRDITKFVTVRNVSGGAHKNGEYLGKTIRWYHAKDMLGTINYIESNRIVPDSDGGKPCMDLPEIFPDDINYDWYIKQTTEMLYDLNYYHRPKQLKFF